MPSNERRRPHIDAATSPGCSNQPADLSGATLPLPLVVGAGWMVLAGALSTISIGSLTVSAALTVALSGLIIAWLPAYAANSELRILNKSATSYPRIGIPLPLWGFLFYVMLSSLVAAREGALSETSVQNSLVYLLFVGSVAAAYSAKSIEVVERGWELLRTVATWTAYLTLAISTLGFLTPLGNRTRAIVAIIVIAILAPGTPRNGWAKFAPFAAVASTVLSLSRTTSVIGLVLLSFTALRQKRGETRPGSRSFKASFLLASGLGSAVLISFFYAPFRDRFLVGDSAFRYGDLSLSTSGRSRLWEAIITRASDRPLLGHGPGSASQLVSEQLRLDHPHNEYLRFYYDFGLVGLGLFAVGYLAVIWRTFNYARQTDHPLHWAAATALVGVALVAVTDNCFVYPYVVLPLGSLVGLSLGLARLSQRPTPTAPSAGQSRRFKHLNAAHRGVKLPLTSSEHH